MNALLTLTKWSDTYDREARLYPGLLAILPVLVLLVCIFGPKHPLLTTAVSLLFACGGPLLLGKIARDLGKALEQRLNIEWGGQPTTILLRHRDKTINALTKKEYHRTLALGLSKAAPTASLEERNPEQADTFYRAGAAWLISKTQDTKRHSLVFRENRHYGFQRNLRGLKWIGVSLSFATLGTSLTHLYLKAGALSGPNQLLYIMSVEHVLPITISAGMLLSWLFLVTKQSVKRAGFAYADRLIRTCEQFASKTKSRKV